VAVLSRVNLASAGLSCYICDNLVRCHLIFLLYAVKIVAGFYKVQKEHIKQDVVGCVFVFIENFLMYLFANIVKIGGHLT